MRKTLRIGKIHSDRQISLFNVIRAIEVHRSKLHDVRDNRLDAESAYSDDSSDFYGSERCVSFAFEVVDVNGRGVQPNANFLMLPIVPKWNPSLAGRTRSSLTSS